MISSETSRTAPTLATTVEAMVTSLVSPVFLTKPLFLMYSRMSSIELLTVIDASSILAMRRWSADESYTTTLAASDSSDSSAMPAASAAAYDIIRIKVNYARGTSRACSSCKMAFSISSGSLSGRVSVELDDDDDLANGEVTMGAADDAADGAGTGAGAATVGAGACVGGAVADVRTLTLSGGDELGGSYHDQNIK